MELKNYEISLWEWKVGANGLEEKKLGVIGSNNMNVKSKAFNPILNTKINGITTFEFTMYTRYYDEEAQDFVDNPWKSLMTNEKIIKLKYDDKWYCFIIKNINESSNNHSITYNCSDAFVEELSKQGFNIELNADLDNNIGTVSQLASYIIDGTDWTISNKSEIILQYNLSYLIEDSFNVSGIVFTEIIEGTEHTTSSGTSYVYHFLDCKDQFIFNNDFSKIDFTEITELDKNAYPVCKTNSNIILSTTPISAKGNYLNMNHLSGYDSKIDKYYTQYIKNGTNTTYNMYTDFEYLTQNYIVNLISNDSEAWNTNTGLITDAYYPDITEWSNRTQTPARYTKLVWTNQSTDIYTSLVSQRSTIKEFVKGDKFVLTLKQKGGGTISNIVPTIKNGSGNTGTIYFNLVTGGSGYNSGKATQYYVMEYTGNGLNWKDLQELSQLRLNLNISTTTKTLELEEVKLFKYILNNNGTSFIWPDDQTTANTEIRTKYFLYDPQQSYISKDDLIISYTTDNLSTLNTNYTPKYNESYEKITTIEASESNRFNLLQKLCEAFECWLHFDISYDNIGKITSKSLYFTNTYGEYNSAGFRYGINLKDTTRKIDSENIVSYMIVKNNANEYATNGFCSISRSKYNYARENSLYNFDYYINQGLINKDSFTNDFYRQASQNDDGGYYTQLYNINIEYNNNANKLTQLDLDKISYESNYTVAELGYNESIAQLDTYGTELYKLTGLHYNEIIVLTEQPSYWNQNEFQSAFYKYKTASQSCKEYEDKKTIYNTLLSNTNLEITTLISRQNELINSKKQIYKQINSKYGNFIKEGSWISEDYFDDNKYYLDAEITLQNSAFPKITYTVNVINIDGIDEYRGYHFNLGDTTYIEDPNFFGYINNVPVKEEIIISEIKYNLDSPDEDSIVVKTYESQFDSLFQMITATTQSLQYNEGQYARAANNISTTGEISYESISNALNTINLDLSNVGKQSVNIDENGITTTGLENKNNIVRIIGGGIYLSADGGETYNQAITSEGINASYINVGTLDTNMIRIMNGNQMSFLWDSKGITAYKPINEGFAYDSNKYVRMNGEGINVQYDGQTIVELNYTGLHTYTNAAAQESQIDFFGAAQIGNSDKAVYSYLNMGEKYERGTGQNTATYYGFSITGGECPYNTTTHSFGTKLDRIPDAQLLLAFDELDFRVQNGKDNQNNYLFKEYMILGKNDKNNGGIITDSALHRQIIFYGENKSVLEARNLMEKGDGNFEIFIRGNNHISCKYIREQSGGNE